MIIKDGWRHMRNKSNDRGRMDGSEGLDGTGPVPYDTSVSSSM